MTLVLPQSAFDAAFWPSWDEISAWLADSLGRIGWSAERVSDAELGLIDSDVVVLLGDCDQLERSASTLRDAGGLRPRTVLWQLDSLPPPGMAPEWIAAGYRLARGETALRLPSGRVWEVLRSALGPVPRRLKWFLVRTATRRSAGPHVSEWDPTPTDLTASARRFRRLRWIERAVNDGWLDHVAVSAPERTRVLSERGIRATFVPIGYHPAMGVDRKGERDIDVAFLGGATPYRDARLGRLRAELATRGLRLVAPPPPCFGEERTALLNRAKMSLNIHREDGFWELSRLRLLYSMACGAPVISEPVTDPSPFVDGVHFVTASSDSLPSVIARLARDESWRRAIVEAGRRLLTTELTMERSAAALVS